MRRRPRTIVGSLAVAAAATVTLIGCASDPGEPGTDYEQIAGTWDQTATEWEVGDVFELDCPAGGSDGRTVWGGGDGHYTADSGICIAAVHAGLITFADGGSVVVERTAGRDSYTGSSANGVETQDYGAWDGSFRFLETRG